MIERSRTSSRPPVADDTPSRKTDRGDIRGGRIHGRIVRALAGLVLGGDLVPGDLLPNEEDLAERFGVSRSSVREAVKTLAAKGLIETRQRVGGRIRPRSAWRLLDPALLSWHPDIRRDPDLVASIVEARRVVEPAASALAARRSTPDDVAKITAAFAAMERAGPDDLLTSCEADLAFHRGVTEASHNIVLCELIGTIEAALRASFMATNHRVESYATSLEAHRRILDRIVARDEAGAREAMSQVLDLADAELHRI